MSETRYVHPALMGFDLRRPLREWDEAIRAWEEKQERQRQSELARREAAK